MYQIAACRCARRPTRRCVFGDASDSLAARLPKCYRTLLASERLSPSARERLLWSFTAPRTAATRRPPNRCAGSWPGAGPTPCASGTSSAGSWPRAPSASPSTPAPARRWSSSAGPCPALPHPADPVAGRLHQEPGRAFRPPGHPGGAHARRDPRAARPGRQPGPGSNPHDERHLPHQEPPHRPGREPGGGPPGAGGRRGPLVPARHPRGDRQGGPKTFLGSAPRSATPSSRAWPTPWST